MSVQFGRWNFDGRPADREYLVKAEGMLTPYGPDGGGTYIKDSVGILFRAFHTTKESRNEAQPHTTPSGAVLTWDGRLDNRAELMRSLRDVLTINSTDVSIVAAAYEEWGTSCLAKLIGDWALSLWNPDSRSLILAKDPIGTRHLYYSFDDHQVTWSTIRDPLLLFGALGFVLCDLGALAAAFRAVGGAGLPLGTMVLSYTLGQAGSIISLPGTTEGGLVGVFALYGAPLALATSAILVYRAAQSLIPLLLGLIGIAGLRRGFTASPAFVLPPPRADDRAARGPLPPRGERPAQGSRS